MQLSETLMLAGIHEVERRGWSRRLLERPDGSVCAVGGLNAAAYGTPQPGCHRDRPHTHHDPVSALRARHVGVPVELRRPWSQTMPVRRVAAPRWLEHVVVIAVDPLAIDSRGWNPRDHGEMWWEAEPQIAFIAPPELTGATKAKVLDYAGRFDHTNIIGEAEWVNLRVRLMDVARALGCRDAQECHMEALRPLRAMGLAQCDQHGTWTAQEVTR